MSGHTVDEIKQETRKYWTIFAALAALTTITVAVSYLDLSPGMAVAVAMLVACVKGGLVAGVFMHLISERTAIYAILLLTVVFFAFVMLGPSLARLGGLG